MLPRRTRVCCCMAFPAHDAVLEVRTSSVHMHSTEKRPRVCHGGVRAPCASRGPGGWKVGAQEHAYSDLRFTRDLCCLCARVSRMLASGRAAVRAGAGPHC